MDSVRYHELMRAAIDGMLHSLDPHSYYLSRRNWEKQADLKLTGNGVPTSIGALSV